MTQGQVTTRIALAMLALTWTTSSRAADTQLWISDSPSDYARAEARGVVVRPDGVLSLGPRTTSSAAESLSVIWTIAVLADGSVALAGDDGRVERWTESGGVKPWVRLPVGQVLSLATDGDGLVAGTGPEGLIYRIGARGDTALLARTHERYVWGLAPAGRGTWWAATGTRGRLLRVSRGKTEVVLDSDESNLVSLVSDGRGGAYAGGDSKGRVLRVTASGDASTAYDAAEDEVRALALASDGALYAAALTASASTAFAPATGSSVSSASDDDESDERAQPQPVRSGVSGGKATLYRIVPDSSVATVWTAPHPFVFALASVPEGVVAATGNRAALYLVGRSMASQWLAAPQGQVTALAVGRSGRLFAATSNPGVLWRVGPERADKGELLSPIHDARRYARFGRVRWRGVAGGAKVELQSRTGNTDPPDTTWTGWRALEDGRVAAPPARYMQWKMTLSGGQPLVDAVEVAWREQNLAPRVEDLVVAPQGVGFREGELQPRSEPVTQTLPGGQRVEYSMSTTTSPRALKELPEWARGLRTLQWRGSDPNGDPLEYRVDVRAEGGDRWTPIGEELSASSFTWDTRGLPDGRYRVRVRASDAPGNAVGEEQTTETTSEPFLVDNTPPRIVQLDVRAEPGSLVASGRAEDEQSMLVRLEITVDEEEWRAVTPEGGLADDRALNFRVRLPDLEPGEHAVALRAVDQAGNGTTRAARVTVPRGR
jgi:hypothetical protein